MKPLFITFIFGLFFVSTLNLQAQENPYLNELKNYRFFGKGKLSTLQLGVSTKDDVAQIFKNECTDKCEFDENWQVQFQYFGDFERSVGNGTKTWEVVPKSEYLGKLYSISLFPKTRISFKKNTFSSNFIQGGAGASASHSDWVVSYLIYQDNSGLSYTIFDRVETKSLKASKADLNNKIKRVKGDLVEINYEISNKQQDEIWVRKE